MEPQDYIVSKIEGDYATLKNIDNGEEVFIAMALLPLGTDKQRKNDEKPNFFSEKPNFVKIVLEIWP